mgnify:CR=1 FL=1|jgi:fimbrial chaperone protein
MPIVKRTIATVTGLLTVLFATVVTASTLLIWPIHPVIESDESATALWVENRGKQPVLTQLRLFSWRQQGGDDQYTPQNDVVVSPPMVEIPAGERQLMRLIRQMPAPAGEERAWRLIIDEVPRLVPKDADSDTRSQAGIKLQMRYSLPLFDYGSGLSSEQGAVDMADDLSWQVIREYDRQYLQVHNAGKRHVRLTEVSLQQGDRRQVVAESLLGYVLPGSYRRWPFDDSVSPGSTLFATVNGEAAQIPAKASSF